MKKHQKITKKWQKRAEMSKKSLFLTKKNKRDMSLYDKRIGGFWSLFDDLVFNQYKRLKVNVNRYFEQKNLSFPFSISSRGTSFNLMFNHNLKIVHFLSKNTLFLFKTVFFLSNTCIYSTIC